MAIWEISKTFGNGGSSGSGGIKETKESLKRQAQQLQQSTTALYKAGKISEDEYKKSMHKVGRLFKGSDACNDTDYSGLSGQSTIYIPE